MKTFTIKKNTFLSGLTSISRFIPSRSTLQVLLNIQMRIRFQGEIPKLEMIAGDGCAFSRCFLNISDYSEKKIEKESLEDGICINASKILLAVRGLPPKTENLKFSFKENSCLLHWGESGKAAFVSFPAADYPPLPFDTVKFDTTLSIETNTFKKAFSRGGFAADITDLRTALTGIFMICYDQKMILASTNGLRLGHCSVPLREPTTNGPGVICKKDIFENFLKAPVLSASKFKTITVSMNKDFIGMKTKDQIFEIVAPLVDATFPKYSHLIRKESPFNPIVDKTEFENKLKSIENLSDYQKHTVIFTFSEDGILTLSAKDPTTGVDAQDEITYKVTNEKTRNFEIAFNGTFILEILKLFGGINLTFHLDTPLASMLMETEDSHFCIGDDVWGDCCFLVMPQRMEEEANKEQK